MEIRSGTADDTVTLRSQSQYFFCISVSVEVLLVELVNLLRVVDLVEKLVGVASLGGQENTVVGKNAQTGTSMGNGLQSVLDLVKSAFRREDGRSGIVASRLSTKRPNELSVLIVQPKY